MIRQHGSSGDSVKHLHGLSTPVSLLIRNAVSCIAGWHWWVAGGQSCLETSAVLLRPWCLVTVPSKERSENSCGCLFPVQICSQAEEICINPRNRVSTAVRDGLRRSATMFATAPELIHRHSVMERHIRSGASQTSLGREKNNTNSSPYSPLETFTLRIGVFETSFPPRARLSHALLSLPPGRLA